MKRLKYTLKHFYVLPHTRQSWETMTSVSAGHIILTPTQPVGSGRPQRESNPGPPHQESRALLLSYRAPRNTIILNLPQYSSTTKVCSMCFFRVCMKKHCLILSNFILCQNRIASGNLHKQR